jgi:hypothetical protein
MAVLGSARNWIAVNNPISKKMKLTILAIQVAIICTPETTVLADSLETDKQLTYTLFASLSSVYQVPLGARSEGIVA